MIFDPEFASFARLIDSLSPWLDQVVIIGGWAHRLYRLHPSARRLDYQMLCAVWGLILRNEKNSSAAEFFESGWYITKHDSVLHISGWNTTVLLRKAPRLISYIRESVSIWC
jgi:hypothetical protein